MKIQRGPATVNGSDLHKSTVQIVWEGAANDDHEPGDLPSFHAPKQPTRIGGVRQKLALLFIYILLAYRHLLIRW